ncbi:MAG: four helix bundle protein [Prolixibacteraceae bacterium]|nr:four helix bundle protein [Prolixibacteraceae bacterium]
MDFSSKIRFLVKKLPKNIGNIEDSKQVVRSSGSNGANYIEANESLGDKDKIFRLRISRKEAKETMYWLTILEKTNQELFNEINELNNEAEELRKIISTIIIKLSKKE